jgi:tetratricopeptide (TPR) repeat protein
VDLTARRAGDTDLTEQECALLHALVSRKGQETSKEELYREVWGYRSMPRGRALDYAIRRLRSKIEDASSKPLYLTSRRGGGFRLEWEPIRHNSSETKFGPPTLSSDWYGARSQVTLLKQRLKEGPRIVSILGPAGVGKTRILLEALQDYESPVLWFSLHEDRDIWSILADFCDAFKATDVPLTGELDTLFEELATAIGLSPTVPHLILDGAENHAHELTSRLAKLVQGNQLRIFVTSRARLGLAGEELIDVSPLEPHDAVQFLRSRLTSQTAFEEDEFLDLVRLLDGLPLALELVSPLLRMVTPSQLVDRLRNSGQTTALHNEFRPLTQLVEGAFGQLNQAQQRLLRVLAILPRGATLETIEIFLGFLGAGLDTLRELVDRSLVISFDDVNGGRRLRVLWAVRSLVSTKAPDETGWGRDEARALLARHAEGFEVAHSDLALFKESNVSLREQMRAELGQAHVWIDALIADDKQEEATRCCLAFSKLTLWSGSARQAAQILVSAAGKIDNVDYQQWLWATAATIAAEVREREDAEAFLSKARHLGASSDEGQARQVLAEMIECRQMGRFDELPKWAEQLQKLESSKVFTAIVCRGLLIYSNSLSFQNAIAEATAIRERVIAIAKSRGLGHAWISIHNLEAFNCFLNGQLDDAAYAYRRGTRVARRFGDQKAIAALERKLSLCLMNAGDHGGAHRARKEAMARINPKSDPDSYSRLLSYEAEFIANSALDEGLEMARAAVELARDGASISALLTCQHRALMLGLKKEGDYPFMDYLHEFEEFAPSREGGYFLGFSNLVRGFVALREGRTEWAVQCLDRGWTFTQDRLGLPEGVSLLCSLAELAAELEDVERCQFFLDEAEKHYQHGDWERILVKRSAYKRARAKLQTLQAAR